VRTNLNGTKTWAQVTVWVIMNDFMLSIQYSPHHLSLHATTARLWCIWAIWVGSCHQVWYNLMKSIHLLIHKYISDIIHCSCDLLRISSQSSDKLKIHGVTNALDILFDAAMSNSDGLGKGFLLLACIYNTGNTFPPWSTFEW
jgi:hypothetical protein